MHGVRRELLQQQAKSLHLPLREVFIPPQCVNPIYEARMEEALLFISNKVSVVLRSATSSSKTSALRENNLARVAMQALFPIWKRDTRDSSANSMPRNFARRRLYRFQGSRSKLRRS